MIRLLIVVILFGCKMQNPKTESEVTEIPQNTGFKSTLQISSRVDTTKIEVREVLKLYGDYIQSQPDSIYDNPYWNSREKAQFEDFDFSRRSMYNGISSSQLLRVYAPFVLSVEPKNQKYQIRVLYANSDTDPLYIGSKVWCIHQLNAAREEGVWKLENLLPEKTRNWIRSKAGFIEYVFPEEHQLNAERVHKAQQFCQEIISRFNPEYKDSFSFYLANGIDEMGELENFDYIFSGVTTGKAREGMILSSKGDEFYPHEFIHKLLPKNPTRGHVIEEGLASFLGTREELTEYLPMMERLAKDFNKRDSYNLENILNNQTAWNGYPVAYPGGALLCEVIHEQKGDMGINKLARGKTDGYEEIMRLTQDILQLDKNNVFRLIENKLKEFE
ncbi:MAG: hypothetical protein K1X68_00915 [Saprospiraceae bacterium]|nr:hypothetical protein [Saprospiraceae bacterium]HMW38496.1 hypothetical protein [Saprospiraceae bacterium]HMX88369.1 hypothetical protein [Saprospiraceae bacterium]HMZ40261.1 hypothetical protein [Saprospiraceae bacterium]HNA65551.1 hypothetical protein [Saprospiraceae bacterium]